MNVCFRIDPESFNVKNNEIRMIRGFFYPQSTERRIQLTNENILPYMVLGQDSIFRRFSIRFMERQLSEKYLEIEQKQKLGRRHGASIARQNNKSRLLFT